MADPRLNSIHLEPFRREQFRAARTVLEHKVGAQTWRAEYQENAADAPAGNDTWFSIQEGRVPPELDYVLLGKDTVYSLKVGLNTIGRMNDNDVVLSEPYLSRRHCVVLVHLSSGCELHDIASKNGTYLNGHKVTTPTPLVSGDEIRMCDRYFIFTRRGDVERRPNDGATLVD